VGKKMLLLLLAGQRQVQQAWQRMQQILVESYAWKASLPAKATE
jgi:hypothetical protein